MTGAVAGALCLCLLVAVTVVQPAGESPAAERLTSTTTTTAPGPPPVVPLPTQPATVATASVASVPIYPWPAAPTPGKMLANPNELGAPLVFLAVATAGPWIEVYLPERPNEATAWVPSEDVSLSQVPYHITISLSARLLTLYDADQAVFSTSVAPGEPSSPTPTGSFYVTEVLKVSPPDTAYGPYALGTSAFSNTYYSFEGGPGQVAIHGTNQPWLIGGYASHGCVRLPNPAITTLSQETPVGTPVQIDP